jgi:hypothetical protein
MKKIAVLIITVLALTILSPAPFCSAEKDKKQTLQEQAFADAKVGKELMRKAQMFLDTEKPSKDNLVIAANLYVRAGQLFARSSEILKSLGESYSTEEDMRNLEGLINYCLESINKINRSIRALENPSWTDDKGVLVAP